MSCSTLGTLAVTLRGTLYCWGATGSWLDSETDRDARRGAIDRLPRRVEQLIAAGVVKNVHTPPTTHALPS